MSHARSHFPFSIVALCLVLCLVHVVPMTATAQDQPQPDEAAQPSAPAQAPAQLPPYDPAPPGAAQPMDPSQQPLSQRMPQTGEQELEASTRLTRFLQDRLADAPQVRGVDILYAMPLPGNAVRLYGTLASVAQSERVADIALEILNGPDAQDVLEFPVNRVDTTRMRVGTGSPVVELMVLEALIADLLGESPRAIVRIQRYEPEAGAITLCGIVESAPQLAQLEDQIRNVERIQHVTPDPVLVAELVNAPGNASYFLAKAVDALGDGDGERLVAAADELLLRGQVDPETWYLRAAGHLLSCEFERAIGDLRIAGLTLVRHRLLERFQATPRQHLEHILAHGPEASLAVWQDTVTELWECPVPMANGIPVPEFAGAPYGAPFVSAMSCCR